MSFCQVAFGVAVKTFGCLQVQSPNILQRSRGKITNIPSTIRNYCWFVFSDRLQFF